MDLSELDELRGTGELGSVDGVVLRCTRVMVTGVRGDGLNRHALGGLVGVEDQVERVAIGEADEGTAVVHRELSPLAVAGRAVEQGGEALSTTAVSRLARYGFHQTRPSRQIAWGRDPGIEAFEGVVQDDLSRLPIAREQLHWFEQAGRRIAAVARQDRLVVVGERAVDEDSEAVVSGLQEASHVETPRRRDPYADFLAVEVDLGAGDDTAQVERDFGLGFLLSEREGRAISHAAGVVVENAHPRPVSERDAPVAVGLHRDRLGDRRAAGASDPRHDTQGHDRGLRHRLRSHETTGALIRHRLAVDPRLDLAERPDANRRRAGGGEEPEPFCGRFASRDIERDHGRVAMPTHGELGAVHPRGRSAAQHEVAAAGVVVADEQRIRAGVERDGAVEVGDAFAVDVDCCRCEDG